MSAVPSVPKPYEYSQVRFGRVSHRDNTCFRCNRVLLTVDELWEGAPHAVTHNAVQRQENATWFSANRGRVQEEALRWTDTGGYHSNNLDCIRMCIVLCEDCKLELLGPFMKFKDESVAPSDWHHERRKTRNDADIQARWDRRKLSRALRAHTGVDPAPSKI